MEHSITEIPALASTKRVTIPAPGPETADRGRLAARIKRSVRRQTSGGVRKLIVEIRPDGILLDGHCDTFYCKQLAQHAAMRLAGSEQVLNHIIVD